LALWQRPIVPPRIVGIVITHLAYVVLVDDVS
jgi:hypothetical protein